MLRLASLSYIAVWKEQRYREDSELFVYICQLMGNSEPITTQNAK